MILVLIESQEAAGDDEVQQQLQGLTGPALQWTTRNANGTLMTAVFDQTMKLERTGMA